MSLIRSGDHVYWIEGYKTIHRAPSAGGATQTLLTTTGVFRAATVVDAQMFVADVDGILRMKTDGTAQTRLLAGVQADHLVVQEPQLFFTDAMEGLRSMTTSGSSSTLLSFTPTGVGLFAVDGATAWITDGRPTSTLYRMASPGSLPIAIAKGIGGYTSALKLAPGLIVWATETAILTLPR